MILKVSALEKNRVVIDVSDGRRYFTDLSSFSSVFCYPKSNKEWKTVAIQKPGFALVWSCKFEVHVDQILALATKIEKSA